jgi:hypothetical protein
VAIETHYKIESPETPSPRRVEDSPVLKRLKEPQNIEDITDSLLEAMLIECMIDPFVKNRLENFQGKFFERKKKSDFELIVNYMKCLFTAINEQVDVQKMIHKRLNTPIGPNNFQKVRLCSPPFFKDRESDVQIFEYSPILDISLYIQMEEILKESVYKESGLGEESIEQRHILHKMVFDSLNELLDFNRVYGLQGVPLKCLTGFEGEQKLEKEECAKVLEKCKNQILDFCKFRAGVLKEKEPGLAAIESIDAIEVLREEMTQKILKEFVRDFWFILFLGL